MSYELQLLTDAEALYRVAAERFVRHARAAVQLSGRFTVALSGGSTPRAMYRLLALDQPMRSEVPWDKVHFFWGDERHVPPDHADSNYRMVHAELLSKVLVPELNVCRILGEQRDADLSAQQYERTLQAFFQLSPGQLPRFDLMLLGLGEDGHTASLFPGTTAVHEKERLVAANWVRKLHVHRITLTVPVFNNAACVIFLVAGGHKATALRAVLEGVPEPKWLPAQLIRPRDGELVWLVDRAAARLLNAATTTAAQVGS
jgi:6-phosphogluconolactonase